MKRSFFLSFFFLLAIAVSAQDKINPVIQKGTRLNYIAHTGDGQDIPFTITVDSATTDFVKLNWSIEGLGSGGWIMKKNSLEKAVLGFWDQPAAGSDVELPDDKIVLLFSKAQWGSANADKKADFDNMHFTVKQPTDQQVLKIKGKAVDAIMLENENASTRLWILNNPAYPVMLKISGNPIGTDFDVQSVE